MLNREITMNNMSVSVLQQDDRSILLCNYISVIRFCWYAIYRSAVCLSVGHVLTVTHWGAATIHTVVSIHCVQDGRSILLCLLNCGQIISILGCSCTINIILLPVLALVSYFEYTPHLHCLCCAIHKLGRNVVFHCTWSRTDQAT